MKRNRPDRESEPLFDLPLDQGSDPAGGRVVLAAQPELPLEAEEELSPPEPPGGAAVAAASLGGSDEPPTETRPAATLFRRRLTAGLADLVIHLGVLGLAVSGSAWLGVPPSRLSLLPLLLFVVGFSFIFHVLPLVFWGRTPGMALEKLTARSLDGRPLTIGQAVRRWLGVVLNVACLGLPFVVLGERSIPDRLSGSSVRS